MSKLIEIIGHSGLGKSTLAYSLAGHFKTFTSAELHVEKIRSVVMQFEDITPEQAYKYDTDALKKLSKSYELVISDTNGFSSYIFGDCSFEEASKARDKRNSVFSDVISIYLNPRKKFEISGIGRYESFIDEEILERAEKCFNSIDNSKIEIILQKHISKDDIRKIIRLIKDII